MIQVGPHDGDKGSAELTPVPTFDEVRAFVANSNKSPGCSGVIAKIIKHDSSELATEIYKLIPIIWVLVDATLTTSTVLCYFKLNHKNFAYIC